MAKKQQLSEETSKATIETWFEDAKKIANVGPLKDFVGHLIADYHHDYGTIVHAITAAGIAAMHCVDHSPEGGISGFQASCIFWEFVRRWNVFDQGPKRMVQYANMLYPQYEDSFQKTISPDTWKWLQEEANKHIADTSGIKPHGDVFAHWKSIASGTVPFGYRVAKED